MFAQSRQPRRQLVLAAILASGMLFVWWGTGGPLPALAQTADPASELHVSYVIASWDYSGAAKKAYAIVDIVDGNGDPVNGTRVVGDWSGCFKLRGASATAETVCWTVEDGTTQCVDGRATVGGKTHSCLKGKNCQFTFTITSVQKDGMTYVPGTWTSSSTWCDPFGKMSALPQQGSSARITLVASQRPHRSTSPSDSQDMPCGCGG